VFLLLWRISCIVSKNEPRGKFVLFKVETCDKMMSEDTAKKLRAFFERARAWL
jgi:hypothetical protein